MAKVAKFETIEEASQAMGVEINGQTRVFLETFVKKAASENAGQKKKDLLAAAEVFGLTGLDEAKENVQTLQIKVLTYLFEEGRHDEMKDFAAKQNLFVTDDGKIHRIRQAVKPIEERNAGMRAGTVGANTIALLKDPACATMTAAELAAELEKRYAQKTTAPSVQWYINFCSKKLDLANEAVKAANEAIAAATEAGDEAALEKAEKDLTNANASVEAFTIVPRTRAAKAKAAEQGGVVLGAELTLEKATAPKGFAKKKADGATGEQLGSELNLEEAGAGEQASETPAEQVEEEVE